MHTETEERPMLSTAELTRLAAALGACRAHGCTCQEYVDAGKVGAYDTCECGHSENIHNEPSAKGTTKRASLDVCPQCSSRNVEPVAEGTSECWDCGAVWDEKVVWPGGRAALDAEGSLHEEIERAVWGDGPPDPEPDPCPQCGKNAVVEIKDYEDGEYSSSRECQECDWWDGKKTGSRKTAWGPGDVNWSGSVRVGPVTAHRHTAVNDGAQRDCPGVEGVSLTYRRPFRSNRIIAREHGEYSWQQYEGTEIGQMDWEDDGSIGDIEIDPAWSDVAAEMIAWARKITPSLHLRGSRSEEITPTTLDLARAHGIPDRTTASRHTALGETKVPGEVDTLRDDSCPICGSDDYRGDTCNSCGFMRPPVIFHDPNTEKAKIEDLRAPKVPVDLACDNCGSVFPASADADTDEQASKDVALATALLRRMASIPPPPPLPGQGTTTPVGGAAPADPTAATPTETTPTVPEEKPTGPEMQTPEQGDLCPSCGKGTLLPKDEVNGIEEEETDAVPVDVGSPGDPVTVDDQSTPTPPDALPVPAEDAAPTEELPTEEDPEGEAPPEGEEEAPEEAPPVPEESPEDAPEGETEEERKKRLERERATASRLIARMAQVRRTASSPVVDPARGHEGVEATQPRRLHGRSQKEKSMSTSPTHPVPRRRMVEEQGGPRRRQASAPAPDSPRALLHATAARAEAATRLAKANAGLLAQAQQVIRTQAAQIEMLRTSVLALAEANASPEALRATAGLRKAADQGAATNGEEVATTDEAAVAPDARVDVETPGSVDSAANTGVTPDATTDLENAQVAEDQAPLNELVDVTSDETTTQDGTGTTTVLPSAPATTEQANPIEESGWKTSAKHDGKTGGDRTWAAMHLAKARKDAGVTAEETLVLAQRIEADPTISVEAMEVEIKTLEAVAAKQASAQRAPRHLVPTGGGSVPSLATSARREASEETTTTVDVSDSLY